MSNKNNQSSFGWGTVFGLAAAGVSVYLVKKALEDEQKLKYINSPVTNDPPENVDSSSNSWVTNATYEDMHSSSNSSISSDPDEEMYFSSNSLETRDHPELEDIVANKENKCDICTMPKPNKTLPCSHKFHYSCFLVKLKKNKPNDCCPQCDDELSNIRFGLWNNEK